LDGSGLHTQIPTNWSDYIGAFLVGLFAKNPTFRALGTRRPLIEETYMNKTLTALVAAATLAGSLATATTASAQGRGFLPGLIVGGIVGGAIVGSQQRYYAPANCYWTRQPIYDVYGNVIGYSRRAVQVCN
jgi:uncharacterized membrane protein YeaQ/YmgE (transglycosylase-associated protein family)